MIIITHNKYTFTWKNIVIRLTRRR